MAVYMRPVPFKPMMGMHPMVTTMVTSSTIMKKRYFLGNLSVIYARNVHKKANFEMTHENNLNLTAWRQLAS